MVIFTIVSCHGNSLQQTHVNEKEIPGVRLIFSVNARSLNPKVKQIVHFQFFICLQVYILSLLNLQGATLTLTSFTVAKKLQIARSQRLLLYTNTSFDEKVKCLSFPHLSCQLSSLSLFKFICHDITFSMHTPYSNLALLLSQQIKSDLIQSSWDHFPSLSLTKPSAHFYNLRTNTQMNIRQQSTPIIYSLFSVVLILAYFDRYFGSLCSTFKTYDMSNAFYQSRK